MSVQAGLRGQGRVTRPELVEGLEEVASARDEFGRNPFGAFDRLRARYAVFDWLRRNPLGAFDGLRAQT